MAWSDAARAAAAETRRRNKTSKSGQRKTHRFMGKLYDTKTGSRVNVGVGGKLHFNIKTGSLIKY